MNEGDSLLLAAQVLDYSSSNAAHHFGNLHEDVVKCASTEEHVGAEAFNI
jgi:hypothetical protein